MKHEVAAAAMLMALVITQPIMVGGQISPFPRILSRFVFRELYSEGHMKYIIVCPNSPSFMVLSACVWFVFSDQMTRVSSKELSAMIAL